MVRILRSVTGKPYAFVIFLFLALSSLQSYSQVVGDYLSQNAGNWSNISVGGTWLRWNGAAWVTPTAIQGYPGFSNTPNVYVNNNNNISIDVSPPNPILNIVIGQGFFPPFSTVTNNSTLTISGTLSGPGTFSQGAGVTLNINGAIGSLSIFVANAIGNTVNYTGIGQAIYSTNYYNLTLSGSGTDNFGSLPGSIAGNLTLSGTVTAQTGASLAIGGNISVGDGTFFNGVNPVAVTGTTTVGSGTSGTFALSPISGTSTFGGLVTVNAGAAWDNSGTSPIIIQGGITNNGSFTATSTYTFNTNNQSLTGIIVIPDVVVTAPTTLSNTGTFSVATSLSGSGTFSQAINSTLNIDGTSAITGLIATNSGNTVNFTGPSQNINSTNYFNLTLNGSGIDILQAGTTSIGGNFTLGGTVSTTAVAGLTIGGDFVLGGGTTFTDGAFSHSIAGNFTNNGTYTANASTVTFNGSALQTIGGSSATTFFNLAINNPTSISLDDGTHSQNKIVANNLTLSNGYLTTDAGNLLVLNSTATATVANSIGGVPQSNSPYVNGPMNKVGNTAFIFPVGFAPNGCVPIGIANSTGAVTDIFQAQYIHSSAVALGNTYTAGLVHVSGCDYWQLNRLTGSATLDITGYWNTNNPCGFGNYVTSPANVVLAHFNGVSWDSFGGSGVGSNATGSVTWATVSTFSPFSLGTDLSGVNPLPIKLDYFTAVKENGYNTLTWKAECSSTSDSFVVERSSDGISFTGIYGVKVYDPSDCSVPFTYNDHTSSGTKVYYRLRMTDVDGSISYSQIILILNNANELQIFKMQPNPVQGSEAAWLSITSSYATTADIVILSIEGREMRRQTIRVQAGATTISLQTDGLASGMYVLRGIFSGGQSNTISFIKL